MSQAKKRHARIGGAVVEGVEGTVEKVRGVFGLCYREGKTLFRAEITEDDISAQLNMRCVMMR